jgi:hypothetical protein
MGRIVSVTFEIAVQKTHARFSVLRGVSELLGLKPGDKIALNIRDCSGKPLFGGVKELKSGTEIYDQADIAKCIKPGQQIRVEASMP